MDASFALLTVNAKALVEYVLQDGFQAAMTVHKNLLHHAPAISLRLTAARHASLTKIASPFLIHYSALSAMPVTRLLSPHAIPIRAAMAQTIAKANAPQIKVVS